MWYNMIQYDTIQYDTMWYNTIQCDTIWYNTIQYDTIRCDTVWYNMIRCNTVQYHTMQCNATQYNAMWYNTIWCNAMWCNIIWHNAIQFSLGEFSFFHLLPINVFTKQIELRNLHNINIIHQYNTMHYDYFLHPIWWHLHRVVGVIGTLHLKSSLDHCIESVVHLHPWVWRDTWEQHLMFIITQLSVMCLKVLFQ